ncbi:malate synthase A [Micromonospora sp. NPDC050417]|uniref:malate synthase A n=1 Tax=Micromonospora sp. NPDC050417 TaxID=3364280 RepID=UPI003788DF37
MSTTMRSQITVAGTVDGPPLDGNTDRFDEILTPAALAFVARLDAEFAGRRAELLAARTRRRERLSRGEETLGWLTQTSAVRADDGWRVAGSAPGLVDRRVEITGPPDRRMTVNALNSGAQVWLADFEDALSPTWSNLVGGQLNLRDAVDGRLDFTSATGKRYRVGPEPATIVVRPRGWHLVEKHVVVDGRPVSASLVDFGLYLFHCGQRQLDRGSGPYFYLPKLESHLEARLWNDVFTLAQGLLGIAHGTIRATVLIETITAAFEMEEILYELREHCAGLNAGRWDYIFSVIKTFGNQPGFVLPDRAEVSMTVPFMRAYTELLVSTCHRRGAYALGGMAAFIPSRDAETNAVAMAKVRQDKEREAADGFDGSWVAHPALVPICREVFDRALGDRAHQLDRLRDDVRVSADELLDIAGAGGAVTEAGLRNNIAVALRYLDAWLGGNGAVAIFDLMEDAATAEIARCQVWQWIQTRIRLTDGRTVDGELVRKLLAEEVAAARTSTDDTGHRWDDAEEIFVRTALAETLPTFFTTGAYATHLVSRRTR